MTIAVVNHKGGTGKTTTTINLGTALAQQGKRVLLVDFDAQGSLSYSLGIEEENATIAELLHGDEEMNAVVMEREGLHVIPANSRLADVELSIARSDDRYYHLRNLLNMLPNYDFILIDCPPSLSLLTLNALVASDTVLVPMQMDVLALRGLDSMLSTIDKVKMIRPELNLLGVIPIMVDPRKNIQKEISAHIQTNYEGVFLFNDGVRSSVKAAEAPSFGKSVVSYAPASTTAEDYKKLAREVLKRCGASKKQLATK